MDFLLKVGKGKYIQEMYDKEYLFFNTFSSFKSYEKDTCGRNDPREANISNRQMTSLQILTSKGKTIKLSEISKQFNSQFNEHPTNIPFNICSLYTLTFDEQLKYERVLCLGERTLFIYDIGGFFQILDITLEQLKIEYSRKPVKYYNYKSFDGELTFHNKDNSFQYQNEYRILLQTSGTETMNIQLPGLKSVSMLTVTEKINNIELKLR